MNNNDDDDRTQRDGYNSLNTFDTREIIIFKGFCKNITLLLTYLFLFLQNDLNSSFSVRYISETIKWCKYRSGWCQQVHFVFLLTFGKIKFKVLLLIFRNNNNMQQNPCLSVASNFYFRYRYQFSMPLTCTIPLICVCPSTNSNQEPVIN